VNKKLILLVAIVALFAVSVAAQTTAPAVAPSQAQAKGALTYEPLSGRDTVGVRWGLVSAAFVLGVAAFAGALGQARAIAAACEGIARNPSAAPAIRLAMIIGLALIESLVLFALVIVFAKL